MRMASSWLKMIMWLMWAFVLVFTYTHTHTQIKGKGNAATKRNNVVRNATL